MHLTSELCDEEFARELTAERLVDPDEEARASSPPRPQPHQPEGAARVEEDHRRRANDWFDVTVYAFALAWHLERKWRLSAERWADLLVEVHGRSVERTSSRLLTLRETAPGTPAGCFPDAPPCAQAMGCVQTLIWRRDVREAEDPGEGRDDAPSRPRSRRRAARVASHPAICGMIARARLAMRRAVTRDMTLDVRQAAERASALALDFMQNCGWIAGIADQVIVDTLGTELKLNLRPDLSRLGMTSRSVPHGAGWWRPSSAGGRGTRPNATLRARRPCRNC